METNGFNVNAANLQIGEVAKRVGVSLRAIRFYEEKGLIKPSEITTAGLRLFTIKDVARLRLIHRLRLIGLPLDDIKLALGLNRPDPTTKKELLERSLNALEMTKAKIKEQADLLGQLEKDNEVSLESIKKCLGCSGDCTNCPAKVHIL